MLGTYQVNLGTSQVKLGTCHVKLNNFINFIICLVLLLVWTTAAHAQKFGGSWLVGWVVSDKIKDQKGGSFVETVPEHSTAKY